MEVLFYGIDVPHEKGAFCLRNTFTHYFLSCFSTPFLYEMNGEFLRGEPGEFLLIPPGTVVYHGPQSKDEIFLNDFLYIKGNDFRDLLIKYPLPGNTVFSIGDSHLLKSCIKKIQKELLVKSNGYEDMIACHITEAVINIQRLYNQHKHFNSAILRIESAREHFMQYPEQEWTLQGMASLCGYSPSHFSALYYKHFGCSPKADLITSRIELAKQLLLYTDFSIAEISERCGFKSIYYFSKYFKKAVGIPPSKYVNK